MSLRSWTSLTRHRPAGRMSADMNNLNQSELRDDVEGIISASDFIDRTAGVRLLLA